RPATHPPDPCARPCLPAKAIRFCPTVQERGQLRQLLWRELGRRPRRWAPPQSFLSSLCPRPGEPLAHGSTAHPESGGDVLLFPALFFELPGASPPSFAPVQPGFLRSHRLTLSPL